MKKEKKEFTKAEVEVIEFEKDMDTITISGNAGSVWGEEEEE